MTTHECDRWRGMAALDVIGQLPDGERADLAEHLAECPSCTSERDEIAAVAALLPLADPAHLTGAEHQETGGRTPSAEDLPADLTVRVLARIRAEDRSDRRRMVRRWAVGVGASGIAAAAAAIAVVMVFTGTGTGGGVNSVELVGQSNVHSSVQLTDEQWGTKVELHERGQTAGQVMTVMMGTSAGSWWSAGSYRTANGDVNVQLSCGVHLSEIEWVDVRDSAGTAVLHGYTG